MISIGICDDIEGDRNRIYELCEVYFLLNQLEHEYIFYKNAEELLDYCSILENQIIDLLFLDIEMDGINGITLMNMLLKNNKVWKIVFVSSHTEEVFQAFSNKTIGFIEKPINKQQIANYLDFIKYEIYVNALVSFKNSTGAFVTAKIDDILYIEAEGSYSKVYRTIENSGEVVCSIIVKKIGTLEKELNFYSFVRVHKSYLVNLSYITEIASCVYLQNVNITIPIGRRYKEKVKKTYRNYGYERVKRMTL